MSIADPTRKRSKSINVGGYAKDKLNGEWSIRDGELHCGTTGQAMMIEFPYQPPNYDFNIEFTYSSVAKSISSWRKKAVAFLG